MLEHIFTLLMLILLQAVLGFDNLLYISLESKRAPKEKQAYVRKIGILLAIVLRIALLFLLINIIGFFKDPVFTIPSNEVFFGAFTIESFIVLFGGVFIIYTAIKEIWHMIGKTDIEHEGDNERKRSIGKVIAMIVVMNVVFSFDSILSAMALTDEFWVMATAIVIGGILMIVLADKVATFLEKNRMYEVLGLFILFIVGIMLITEGAELAGLMVFNNPIEHMSKTTFYFVIVVLVIVDIVQGRYQKKLIAEQERLVEKEQSDV